MAFPSPLFYLLSIAILVAAAALVFRVAVRSDYLHRKRLSLLSSSLELLVWGLFFAFPYTYNPPDWPLAWQIDFEEDSIHRIAGFVMIVIGMIGAFGTMAWFGIRRAFGMDSSRLIRTGPYRFTRNPQIVVGSLMVLGSAAQYPSWYAMGWIAAFAVISHLMVMTEEEHLSDVFGDEYRRYRSEVSRYIRLTRSV